MSVRRRQHYLASIPLWVVLLCCSAAFIAFSSSLMKLMGMGASLINDPFPLLNSSPFSQKSSCLVWNYLVEMEILPPSPIEYCLPPLFIPWYSHIWNINRECLGLWSKLLRSKESAKAKAILQSSVQMLCRLSLEWIYLLWSTSLKSNLIKSFLSLSKQVN